MNVFNKVINYFSDPVYRFVVNRKLGRYNKLPDEEYLKLLYKVRRNQELNLNDPQTFNEKIQWLKIHDRKAIYTTMVDKCEAKEYVAQVIGKEYIIPTLGVWDSFNKIDFDKLPNQFVLKCTHDSGGLIICRDKSKLDYKIARSKINKSLNNNYYYLGREWPYKNVRPRIIAESYMEQEDNSGLTDYKFFCFGGKPLFLYVSKGLENHATAEISFYNMNGQEMPFHRKDYKPYHNAKMPQNFDDMKIVAERLAQSVGAPFVRIDLYSINGRIYFSEITFSPCSGMIPFDSDEADIELGKFLKLPNDFA